MAGNAQEHAFGGFRGFSLVVLDEVAFIQDRKGRFIDQVCTPFTT